MNYLQFPEHLSTGNARQRAAFDALKKLEVFDILRSYQPIVAGTIPIDVDIPGSDIDVICQACDLDQFGHLVEQSFRFLEGFQREQSKAFFTASFRAHGFTLEIYAEDKQTTEQNAYRHMIAEDRLLRAAAPEAREEIRAQKKAGLKTEPAFAKVFQIEGDPYAELLKLADAPEATISEIARRWKAD